MTHRKQTQLRSLSRRAFSLAEVVCVTLIIAILGAIAMPRYTGAITRERLESAARRIVSDLAIARRRAMLTDSSQVVTFDVANNKYVLLAVPDFDGKPQDHVCDLAEEPYGAQITYADFTGASEAAGDTAVVFDIYGKPDSAGRVTIKVGPSALYVLLDENTGAASVTNVRPFNVPDL